LYLWTVGLAGHWWFGYPAEMASLEGICAPTRADSDAPAGLTSMHREAPPSTLVRAREGPGVRLLFDLLSSCSGLLKHAAATTLAAVTLPTLTFNVRRVVRPGFGPMRSRCGTGGSRRDGSEADAYDTAAVQNRGRRRSWCCCTSRGRCREALPLLRNPACSTSCRLAWQRTMSGPTSPFSHIAAVSWSP
jgi:hypothetical protein